MTFKNIFETQNKKKMNNFKEKIILKKENEERDKDKLSFDINKNFTINKEDYRNLFEENNVKDLNESLKVSSFLNFFLRNK